MTVTITKELDDTWDTPENLAAMSDDEVIALVMEDLVEFADCASWSVER